VRSVLDRQALSFLKKLVEAPSPSGCEQPAQELVRARLKGAVDELRTDVHGNVIAVRNPDAPFRVMLAGHCDEIGLMVTHIDEKGFVYFERMAWWDPFILAGQWVDIHNERGVVPGVIARKSIHLQEKEDYEKVPKFQEYWIDIGARDRKDAFKAVSIGDMITICRKFRGLRNGLFTGRGLDDRAGTWVVVETMRRIRKTKLRCAVYGVSTVQEEIGMRGAQTAAFGINPHVGIAAEVGFASDSPAADKRVTGETAVGKGPLLYRGPNVHPKLGRLMEDVARRQRIPFQMQLLVWPLSTGTDAFVMQVSRAGVATGHVGIATRYLHSSVEVASLEDLDNAVALLSATLSELGPELDLTL